MPCVWCTTEVCVQWTVKNLVLVGLDAADEIRVAAEECRKDACIVL